MKFKWLLFPLLLLMFVGCNSDSKKPNAEQATINIAVPSWYAPEELPALAQALGEEQGKVEFKTLFGKREALLQKIMLGAKRGELADAALVRNEWLGRLAAEKLIDPIPTQVAQIVREKSLPALLPAVTQGEQVWAVPFDADALVLWHNKTLWKEPFASSPETAVRYTLAFPAARSLATAMAFLPWYFCADGNLLADGQVRLNPFAARVALEAMLIRAPDAATRQSLAAMEQADVFSCLAAGDCASTVGGSWERSMLQRQSSRGGQIEAMPFARVFPAPANAPVKPITLIGGWSFVLLPGAHADTGAFLAKLFGAEVQRDKLRQNSLLPVNRDTLADPWFSNNPDGPAFKQSLETGRALPLHSEMLTALEHIATMVAEVFLTKKTPEQAIAETVEAIAAGKIVAPQEQTSVPELGLLRVKRPGEQAETFTAAMLAQLERTKLGDLSVIALSDFCPECGPVQVRILAADGFKKSYLPEKLKEIYLEPEHMRVLVDRGNGEIFTIRDAVEIAFSAVGGEGQLTVIYGDKKRVFTREDLAALRETGTVYFTELVDLVGRPGTQPKVARLEAADGYKREIPWAAFQEGKLVLEGMQAIFDGLSSKDQIRDLVRIEY